MYFVLQVLKERSQLSQLLNSVQVDSDLTEAPRELEETCDRLTATVQVCNEKDPM